MTSPASALTRPSMILIRLVLPAPLGPSRPTTSPRAIVSETDVSAVRRPYRLLMPEHQTAGEAPPTTASGAVPGAAVVASVAAAGGRAATPEGVGGRPPAASWASGRPLPGSPPPTPTSVRPSAKPTCHARHVVD